MNGKILIVDDEPNVLISLAALFKEAKPQPITASRARTALQILRSNTDIDVIVSDQRMPDMTGVELFKEAKEISPSTVRILLTGYSDLNEVLNSVNSGEVYRYILKPWDAQKLRTTVRLACEISQRTKRLMTTMGESAPPKPVVVEKMPIMFIDNNHTHLNSFKEIFAPNYVVNISSSAESAMDVLKRSPIAAIVTELNLPDTNMVEFLTSIKARHPHTAIIVLSSIKDSNLAIQLINQVQVFRYLVRPLRRDALENTIRTAVELYKTYTATPGLNAKIQEEEILGLNPAL
jgi:DNA-binding NtrC family response regulator